MLNKNFLWGILALTLSACDDTSNTSALVNVTPVFGQQAVNCQSNFVSNSKTWSVNQFRFFISDIELKDKQGNWHAKALKLTENQSQNVALLGIDCASASHSADEANWQIQFLDSHALQGAQSIRFSLGVPFEENHLNPLKQPSPLNDSSMFWVWQTGHKFLRLEVKAESINKIDNWLFHLGSTGCQSPSVMRAPDQACLYPNLYQYELPLSSSRIVFDVSSLLSDVTLTNNTGCQSAHNDENCQQLFRNLAKRQSASIFRIRDAN